MSFPTGATAILLFVCMLSLFSTNYPNIIVLHSANTSEIQATKKPHNYHKIAVWQKDDRIRKSPLKFCVYHYSELEGDCQAALITELCNRCKVCFSFFQSMRTACHSKNHCLSDVSRSFIYLLVNPLSYSFFYHRIFLSVNWIEYLIHK